MAGNCRKFLRNKNDCMSEAKWAFKKFIFIFLKVIQVEKFGLD
jgi:hypothetical protein